VPTADAPPGAGLRDARASRLAGRRGSRPGAAFDEPTQMVPLTGAEPEADWPPSGAAGGNGDLAGARGATAGSAAGPLGWVTPRRSGRPVPAPVRALIWAAAFGVSLLVTATLLKKVGLLDVNTAIDLFAGTGPRRFGILLVMLPLWALLSAAIAHFSLEALARRRRPRDRARGRRSPSGTGPPEPTGVRFPG
jgi:hypothetical protein